MTHRSTRVDSPKSQNSPTYEKYPTIGAAIVSKCRQYTLRFVVTTLVSLCVFSPFPQKQAHNFPPSDTKPPAASVVSSAQSSSSATSLSQDQNTSVISQSTFVVYASQLAPSQGEKDRVYFLSEEYRAYLEQLSQNLSSFDLPTLKRAIEELRSYLERFKIVMQEIQRPSQENPSDVASYFQAVREFKKYIVPLENTIRRYNQACDKYNERVGYEHYERYKRDEQELKRSIALWRLVVPLGAYPFVEEKLDKAELFPPFEYFEPDKPNPFPFVQGKKGAVSKNIEALENFLRMLKEEANDWHEWYRSGPQTRERYEEYKQNVERLRNLARRLISEIGRLFSVAGRSFNQRQYEERYLPSLKELPPKQEPTVRYSISFFDDSFVKSFITHYAEGGDIISQIQKDVGTKGTARFTIRDYLKEVRGDGKETLRRIKAAQANLMNLVIQAAKHGLSVTVIFKDDESGEEKRVTLGVEQVGRNEYRLKQPIDIAYVSPGTVIELTAVKQ